MKMYLNRNLLLCLLGFVLAANVNCSSSTATEDSVGDTAAGITSITELPQATGPVAEAADASLSLTRGALYLATTGMPLGTTDGDSFDTDSSMAACEMFNQTKSAIQNAAQADLIQCYVTQTVGAYIAAQDSSDADALTEDDVYDDEYHIFALDFSGVEMEGGPSKIKFKVAKDSSGNITGFEMFSCGDSGDSDVQSEYLSQTITALDEADASTGATHSLATVSKGFYTGGDGEGAYQTSVSGGLLDGEYVGSKTIAMNFDGDWGDGANWGDVTFVQSATSATIEGYNAGSYSSGGYTGTYANQIVGSMQLLDANVEGEAYNIGLLALGDGAVSGVWNSTNTGPSFENPEEEATYEWGDEFVEGWDGDTTLADAESIYIAELTGATMPTATEPTIAFTSDETWDCSGEPEVTIDFAELFSGASEEGGFIPACTNLELDHQWINCWDVTGQNNQ